MRVVGTLIFTLAVLIYSIVCPRPYVPRIKTEYIPISDIDCELEIVESTPEQTRNIRILHLDGVVRPVEVNLNMVARGQTIIGWDDHGLTRAIYDPEGEPVFQRREDRTTYTVTYDTVRRWGVLGPSPTDPELPPEMYLIGGQLPGTSRRPRKQKEPRREEEPGIEKRPRREKGPGRGRGGGAAI